MGTFSSRAISNLSAPGRMGMSAGSNELLLSFVPNYGHPELQRAAEYHMTGERNLKGAVEPEIRKLSRWLQSSS
jgi:hypothetical protein